MTLQLDPSPALDQGRDEFGILEVWHDLASTPDHGDVITQFLVPSDVGRFACVSTKTKEMSMSPSGDLIVSHLRMDRKGCVYWLGKVDPKHLHSLRFRGSHLLSKNSAKEVPRTTNLREHIARSRKARIAGESWARKGPGGSEVDDHVTVFVPVAKSQKTSAEGEQSPGRRREAAPLYEPSEPLHERTTVSSSEAQSCAEREVSVRREGRSALSVCLETFGQMSSLESVTFDSCPLGRIFPQILLPPLPQQKEGGEGEEEGREREIVEPSDGSSGSSQEEGEGDGSQPKIGGGDFIRLRGVFLSPSRSMRCLRYLSLNSCGMTDKAGIALLSRLGERDGRGSALCPSLSEIWMENNSLGAGFVRYLADILCRPPMEASGETAGTQIRVQNLLSGASTATALSATSPHSFASPSALAESLEVVSLVNNPLAASAATHVCRLVSASEPLPVSVLSAVKVGGCLFGAEGNEKIAAAVGRDLRRDAAEERKEEEREGRLRELGLGCNKIGVAGARALGLQLPLSRHLSVLWLKENRLGDEGAVALARGLSGHLNLRKLGLSCNQIGRRGFRALESALRGIPIGGAGLSSSSASSTSSSPRGSRPSSGRGSPHSSRRGGGGCCGSLSPLSVSYLMPARSCEDSLVSAADRMVEAPVRRGNGAVAGARVPIPLEVLWVNKNDLGDAGAESIARLLEAIPSLREVYMQTNRVGDEGAAAIASALGHPTKTVDEVYGERCTGGPRLLLSMAGNSISDAGARALAGALPGACASRRFALRLDGQVGEQIGETGGVSLAEGCRQVWAQGGCLEVISLSGNQAGSLTAGRFEEVISSMSPPCPHLTEVTVFGPLTPSADIPPALRSLSRFHQAQKPCTRMPW